MCVCLGEKGTKVHLCSGCYRTSLPLSPTFPASLLILAGVKHCPLWVLCLIVPLPPSLQPFRFSKLDML